MSTTQNPLNGFASANAAHLASREQHNAAAQPALDYDGVKARLAGELDEQMRSDAEFAYRKVCRFLLDNDPMYLMKSLQETAHARSCLFIDQMQAGEFGDEPNLSDRLRNEVAWVNELAELVCSLEKTLPDFQRHYLVNAL